MPLAKLITPKRIKLLGVSRTLCSLLLIAFFSPAFSQDNSPYTRYGLGDIVPNSNINSRGMGGVSAGYNDIFSINFNNPASYGSFQAIRELKSKRLRSGRAILDLGVNIENRTLIDPRKSTTTSFKASNALFSHLQVGVPLRENWGLSFGLRPVSRISYKIFKSERLYDPNTGAPIDSAVTLNEGDGGAYLASIGIGHRFNFNALHSLSLGANGGYMFGKKDYSTRRSFINDTIQYNAGNFQTKTTFGNLYFNFGLQYQLIDTSKNLAFTFGAFGNLKQTLNGSQDVTRETYFYDANSGNVRIDSVYEKKGTKGTIDLPSSYTAGFTLQRYQTLKKNGWIIGVDFSQTNWDNYRFYGQRDSVRNKWELRIGGEIRPSLSVKKSYLGNLTYRAGVFFGPDYISVKDKLPVFGASFGVGIPFRPGRQNPWQATIINLAFEYIKRGNDNNLLKENMFRISVGFSLSDFWFVRKQYE